MHPQAEDEIEVTKKMIEAGVNAYLSLGADMGDIEVRVEVVYLAMVMAMKEESEMIA